MRRNAVYKAPTADLPKETLGQNYPLALAFAGVCRRVLSRASPEHLVNVKSEPYTIFRDSQGELSCIHTSERRLQYL